ncbi:MAG TPA: tripartite tricarboxylate transporter substrate binding protein [Xanthobacteraceae bacterium]|nr:tripartite tricarboxylate transporter substrate binding protein [Xanthobacteraceae bacterium]
MPISRLTTITVIALAAATQALAQSWPTRPLTMVVPYAAGGPADIVSRLVVPRMSEVLGQQIVVENVGGAGGITGAARVARATPDGYQFMMGPAGLMTQNEALYKHLPYDAVKDFTGIGMVATAPPILIVRKDLPVNNLQDFIAYAKTHQGLLKFGSAGAGSGPHVTCLLLNSAIGITAVTHIPYRGSAMAEQDLVAGRFDYMCDFIATALPQIRGDTVKAIATLTRERTPVLPDLASAAEQGLKDFDTPGWYSLVAPAATPPAVIARLNQALGAALDDAKARESLQKLGNTVVPKDERSPEWLNRFIRSEIEKWGPPIRASGTSLD